MGQLLKFVGVLSVAGYFFGNQISDAIWNRIEFSFDRLRSGDIRFWFERGQPRATLTIRLKLRHDLPGPETLTNLRLTFMQQGMLLGYLNHTVLEVLDPGRELLIPLTIQIPPGPFLERLAVALTPGNNNSLLAPLQITGKATFASRVSLPINRSLSLADML